LGKKRLVSRRDIFDVRRVQAEVAHRRRPVEQSGETRTSECLTQAGYLWVIDAKRNDA